MLNPEDLLTPEESAQVDSSLMTAKDRFSTRVAIYALRILKQIAAEKGMAAESVGIAELGEFLDRDEAAQQTLEAQSMAMDSSFKVFWAQIIAAAHKPLGAIAQTHQTDLANLELCQIIHWFEAQSKASLSH